MQCTTEDGRVYYEDLWGNEYSPVEWFQRQLESVIHDGRVTHGDPHTLADTIADLIDVKIKEALNEVIIKGQIVQGS